MMGDDLFDVNPDELARTLEDLDDLDSNLFGTSKTKKPFARSDNKTKQQGDLPKPKMDDDFLFGDYSPSSAGGTRREMGRRRQAVRFTTDESSGGRFLDKKTESLASDQKKDSMPLSRSNASSEGDEFLSLGSRQRGLAPNQVETRQRARETSLDWLSESADANLATPLKPPDDGRRDARGADLSWLTGDGLSNRGSSVPNSEQGRPRGRISKEVSDELGFLDSGTSSALVSKWGSTRPRTDSEVKPRKKEEDANGSDWLQLREKMESMKSVGQASSDGEASSLKNIPKGKLPPEVAESKESVAAAVPVKPSGNQQEHNSLSSENASSLHEGGKISHHYPQMQELLKLQGLVKSLKMECKYLKESLEQQQQLHQEEVNTLTALHEKQIKILEESYQQKETSLRTGYDYRIQMLESQIERLEDDKRELVSSHQAKLEELEGSRREEMKHVKELHISLQATVEQLQKRSKDLDKHEDKVEEKEKNAYLEKFACLEAKEKQLSALENRLRHQAEVADEERGRLQQLVLRLEAHVQKQTKEVEEEKWFLQQEQGKLQVKLKFLEEEKQHMKAQMEMERRYLQKAKDALSEEQRNIVQKIAEERKALANEREALQLLKQTQKLEEVKLAYEYKQQKNEYESQCELLLHKKEQLENECQRLQQSVDHLRDEQNKLEQERREMATEQEKLMNLAANLRIKSESIEQMYQTAVQMREEGYTSLQRAKETELKHNLRMQQIQTQIEALQSQERQLIEMQKIIADENGPLLLNQPRDSLCPVCRLYMNPSYSGTAFSRCLDDYPNIVIPTAQSPPMTNRGLGLGIDMLKMSSKLDKEYLQEEASFLQSLAVPQSSSTAKLLNPKM